jgi:Protein of unknown function (DUF3800)
VFLLYVDESGSALDPNSKFFVLAGVAIFERSTHWLDQHLTNIAARFDPIHPASVELHASPMRTGRDGWDAFHPNDRAQACADILHLLSDRQSRIKVFVSVVEKSLLPAQDILPHAFEKLAVAFDNYLIARHKNKQDAQRGIAIFDNSTYEQSIQALTRVFKHQGHADGYLRNFAEVPLFLDSKASRLIQLADSVAYWIYRRYAALDDRGYRMIEPHIHGFSGGKQGAYELLTEQTQTELNCLQAPSHPFPTPTAIGTVLNAAKSRVA